MAFVLYSGVRPTGGRIATIRRTIMTDVPPVPRPAAPRWLPWIALLLTILGPFVYGSLLEQATLRSTGAIAWLLMAAGLGLGVYCVIRAPRRLTGVLAGIEAVLVGLFVFAFFFLLAVPKGTGAPLTQAPDFTLPDQEGRPFTLSAELAKGPVLLIFYRGHW